MRRLLCFLYKVTQGEEHANVQHLLWVCCKLQIKPVVGCAQLLVQLAWYECNGMTGYSGLLLEDEAGSAELVCWERAEAKEYAESQHSPAISALVFTFASHLISFLKSAFRSRTTLVAENLFLRKQLAFYREHKIRPQPLTDAARLSLVLWS